MSETYVVEDVYAKGVVSQASNILVDEPDSVHAGSSVCSVSISLNGETSSATAGDYFYAFRDARAKLKSDGFRFRSYGASQSIWPSAMCCDMGLGMQAY